MEENTANTATEEWLKKERKRLDVIINSKPLEQSKDLSPEEKKLHALIYNEPIEEPEELSPEAQTLKVRLQQLFLGNFINFPKVNKVPEWAATA